MEKIVHSKNQILFTIRKVTRLSKLFQPFVDNMTYDTICIFSSGYFHYRTRGGVFSVRRNFTQERSLSQRAVHLARHPDCRLGERTPTRSWLLRKGCLRFYIAS